MKAFKRILSIIMASVLVFSVFAMNASAADMVRSGDVNGDGNITAADARTALRIAAQISYADAMQRSYADADGNGKVTSADARLILRVAARIDDEDVLAMFDPENIPETPDVPIPPEEPVIPDYDTDTKEMTLCEGDSQYLSYFILKDRDNAEWTSSNPACVTVDKDGVITAVKRGFSCIIVECGDDVYYYEITVKNAIQIKADSFRNKYPDGYYWNKHTPSAKYPDVTETPCDDHESGTYAYCKGQCAGFAALMFQEVHGVSMYSYGKKGVTWDTVKPGDYIRLVKHHSIYVLDVIEEGDVIGYDHYAKKNITADEKQLIVVHCNWGWTCNIIWDDVFTQKYAIDPNYSYTI